MFGMNFANEALPPMFIISSAAEDPKLKAHFVWHMKHVTEQYGYTQQHNTVQSFPLSVGFGKDGSLSTKNVIY